MRFVLGSVVGVAMVGACSSPAAIEVSLDMTQFATSGGNLFNCSSPAQPATQHALSGAAIACTPKRSGHGYSSEPVTVTEQVGCGDGHGALVSVTCAGTTEGAVGITGTVSMMLSGSCDVKSFSLAEAETFTFDDLESGATVTSPPASQCAAFSTFCTPTDACAFNDFGATFTVTNLNAP